MKNKKLLALVVAASLASTGVLTACGNNKAEETKNNSSATNNKTNEENKGNGEKDKDQFAVYPISSEPKTLDPSKSSDTDSSRVLTQTMEGLTRITQENGQDKIVPGIAESWETSEDGLTWTFHLRDAKWNDGEAITAQQFEYGIKRTLAPDTASVYSFILYPISNALEANTNKVSIDEVGVKAIDEKTLQITLDKPCPYFLDLTYFKVMYPQRKEVVEKYGESYGQEAEQMQSTGAFLLKEWNHGNNFVFEKNPNYWAADEVVLDKLTFKVIKERSSSYNALLSGQTDIGAVVDPAWKVKFEQTGEFNYQATVLPRTDYTYFNQETRYFKNAKIRKAFAIALDNEEYNEITTEGAFMPATAWIPPTVQINGEDFRAKANFEPITKLKEENPDPKALLIEGLKELGEDPDPAKMDITILSTAVSEKGKENLAYKLQVYKDVLGVNIKPDVYEWAVFSQKVKSMEYEVASAAWTGDYNDPNTFLDLFVTGGGVVPTGWSNEEFDKLIADAAKETDPEKRFEMLKRAEEILVYEDAVIAPQVYARTSTFTRKYLKNVIRPLFGTIDFSRAYTSGR